MSSFDIALEALARTFDNVVKSSPMAIDITYRKWTGKGNYDPSIGYAPDTYEDITTKAALSGKIYNEYEKVKSFEKSTRLSNYGIRIIVKQSDLPGVDDLSARGKDKILIGNELYSVSEITKIQDILYIIEAER